MNRAPLPAKLKIAWLAPCPTNLLEPALKVSRQIKVFHPCSWIVNLSQELARNEDIELHLLTESHLVPYSQTVILNRITYHVLKNGVPLLHRRFPPALPLDALCGFRFDVRRLTRTLRAIQPDIVHAHGTEGPYALAAGHFNRPALISMQGIIHEILKVSPSFRLRLLGRTERDAVCRGRYFSCRTEFDRNFVSSTNPAARIFVIHEAMNPVFFENDWQADESCGVLYVGELLPRKGVEVLLRALAAVGKRLPQVQLRLIGAGTDGYVRHLKDLCRQLGIAGNAEFLGFLPPQQIAQWHTRSQLFVLPSENENSPNTLAEAMVSGLPVIATAVGGIPSMVEDRQTGLLFERNNSQQLAKLMIELLTQADMRKRLGDNARTQARSRHRPDIVARQTLQAYREILDTQQGTK